MKTTTPALRFRCGESPERIELRVSPENWPRAMVRHLVDLVPGQPFDGNVIAAPSAEPQPD